MFFQYFYPVIRLFFWFFRLLPSLDICLHIFTRAGELCILWQYRLWSFQTGGTKLERFLPKNQHTQRKFLNFDNWTNGELRSLQKSNFLKLIILIFHVKKLNN